jgi:diguanylate cyclase (GGDEF)-like protein/PAS domain S-box-containing protein
VTAPTLPTAGRPHSRLQAFGPFVAVFLLLATLWGLVLGFAVVQERRMLDGAQQQLRLINNAVSQQTDDLLQGVDRDLQVLEHWLARAQRGDPRQDLALADLVGKLDAASAGLLAFGFVGADGRVLPLSGTPAGLSAMPPVELPAAAGGLGIGDPVRRSTDNTWQWPLTRRLATPADDIVALAAWVDLSRLGALHERLREKPAGAIALVRRTGTVVLRTPHIDGLIGRNLLGDNPPAAQSMQGPQGVLQYGGGLTGGQPRLVSYERLASTPVTVMVSQEVDEILSAFRARRNLGVGVLALLTVAGIAFSVSLARSQRESRRSQARFDAVGDAFPLGLFITDTSGAITYANEAYLQMLGQSRDQMAWGWTVLIDPQHRERVAANWRQSAADGTPLKDVITVRQPGGRQVILSVRSAGLHDGGKLVGRIGSIEDITDRVHQQRAERMLAAIFEKSTDVVAQVSASGEMLYLNPAGRALLGLKAGDPVAGLNFDDFMPAHRETQVRDIILPTALATGVWVGETSVLAGEGREIDVSEMLIVHRDEHQKVETYSVVMRDISEELRARASLQRSESVLKVVASTLPVLVAVADRQQRYLFANDAFARWVGRSQDRLVGRSAREVLGEAEYARRQGYIEAALSGQRVMFEAHSDGSQYFETTYIPFRNAEGEVAGLVALSQDVTAHKQRHQKLLDASQTDVLTGALNRAGFDLRVGEALERARDGGHDVALLFIDLDRFKPVNDEHGHATGDALLEGVAQRLQRVLRPSDMLARLGGDEFAVVLPEVKDDDAARTVARKIVATLGEPFEVEGKRLSIGASVGVALSAHGGDTVAALTQRADGALYQAKRAGRGRFAVAAGGP